MAMMLCEKSEGVWVIQVKGFYRSKPQQVVYLGKEYFRLSFVPHRTVGGTAVFRTRQGARQAAGELAKQTFWSCSPRKLVVRRARMDLFVERAL